MQSIGQRIRRARMPLVPLLPAIVVLVGVATAIAVGFLGLNHLRRTSDSTAEMRAEVLSRTLAIRLRATGSQDHGDVVRRAARRSGTEMAVVSADGTVVVDATVGLPAEAHLLNLVAAEQGVVTTRIGRTKFSVRPLGLPFQHLALITFVPAPLQPEGARALVRAVLGLTALLLGVAAVVAYLFGRDLGEDLSFLRKQVVAMADPDASPAGRPVPIRIADSVGLLTSAFNTLVDRFTAAERSYQIDLNRVASLDRDRAAFLGALSHELRTPLNAILGFADVLLSEVDGELDPDTRENLEMVRASGSHLRGLIDDILELSAIESGQLRLSAAQIDLRAVTEDVVRELSARLAGKPIALSVSATTPAYTWADERRMWQILSNVIGNAIKFTERGAVSVELGVKDGRALITVTDTGSGIPESELESIFDEYRQGSSNPAREGGHGLGLFIARRLVTMHGGTIEVRSKVGNGSQFRIMLPALGSHPPPRPAQDSPHKHGAAS